MEVPTSNQLFLGILYISFKRFSENLEFLIIEASPKDCPAFSFATTFRKNLNLEYQQLTYLMFAKHLANSSVEDELISQCKHAADAVEITIKRFLDKLRSYNTPDWKRKVMFGQDLTPFRTKFDADLVALESICRRIKGILVELEAKYKGLEGLGWNLKVLL